MGRSINLVLVISVLDALVTNRFNIMLLLNSYQPRSFVDALAGVHSVTSHRVVKSRLPDTVTLFRPNAAIMYLKNFDLRDFYKYHNSHIKKYPYTILSSF